MTQDEFGAFAVKASRHAVLVPGAIGRLRLTQSYPFTKTVRHPKLREPEMKHAFAQIAEREGIEYGIEVPTAEKFRFRAEAGTRTVSARHDIALYRPLAANRNAVVLVELKEGQPHLTAMPEEAGMTDARSVSKDIEKLLAERADGGKCMFHILQFAGAGTLDAVRRKYAAAVSRAINDAEKRTPAVVVDADPCWFTLAVLIPRWKGVPEPGPRLQLLKTMMKDLRSLPQTVRSQAAWASIPLGTGS